MAVAAAAFKSCIPRAIRTAGLDNIFLNVEKTPVDAKIVRVVNEELIECTEIQSSKGRPGFFRDDEKWIVYIDLDTRKFNSREIAATAKSLAVFVCEREWVDCEWARGTSYQEIQQASLPTVPSAATTAEAKNMGMIESFIVVDTQGGVDV